MSNEWLDGQCLNRMLAMTESKSGKFWWKTVWVQKAKTNQQKDHIDIEGCVCVRTQEPVHVCVCVRACVYVHTCNTFWEKRVKTRKQNSEWNGLKEKERKEGVVKMLYMTGD